MFATGLPTVEGATHTSAKFASARLAIADSCEMQQQPWHVLEPTEASCIQRRSAGLVVVRRGSPLTKCIGICQFATVL